MTIKLVLKWSLLVSLSAVASFVAAVLEDFSGVANILAMVLGMATFVFVYAFIEALAIKHRREDLLRSLKIGVIIKIALQLLPGIELGAGYVAAYLVGLAGLSSDEARHGFIETYAMTVIVGLILSMVVFLIATVHLLLHDWVRNMRLRRRSAS